MRVNRQRLPLNIEMSLTYEDFVEFTKIDKCHYCSCLIVWTPWNALSTGSHLDRKDNKGGYTKQNCAVCCWPCNELKGNRLTYEEMMLLRENLVEIYKRRTTLAISQRT